MELSTIEPVGGSDVVRARASSSSSANSIDCAGILACLSQSDETTDSHEKHWSSTDEGVANNEEAVNDEEAAISSAHDAVDLSDTSLDIIFGHHSSPRQQPHLFLFAITVLSDGGMALVSFVILAGGKWGYGFSKEIFETMTLGAVDSAVSMNVALQ